MYVCIISFNRITEACLNFEKQNDYNLLKYDLTVLLKNVDHPRIYFIRKIQKYFITHSVINKFMKL